MAIQLAEYNIRVNSVVPNKIGSPVGKDEFDPSRPIVNLRNRAGAPADLANAVAFLVSDQSDFIVGTDLFRRRLLCHYARRQRLMSLANLLDS